MTTVSSEQHMTGEVHPSALAALSIIDSKEVLTECWVNRKTVPVVGFELNDLPATFCSNHSSTASFYVLPVIKCGTLVTFHKASAQGELCF